MSHNFSHRICVASVESILWVDDVVKNNTLAYFKVSVAPGELLIKREDAIQSVYFVQRGMLEIVQQDFIVAIIGTKIGSLRGALKPKTFYS